jgi:hypothetical protein
LLVNPIDGAMPVFPRTGFNSSQLVRLLAGLDRTGTAGSSGIRPGAAPKQTFAERLSLWLAWADAISLAGALAGAAADSPAEGPVRLPAATRPGAAARARTAMLEFKRVRAECVSAIGNAGAEPGLVALRRHYVEQQRSMSSSITALRAHVRAALTDADAALGRLAALDAVLERALAAREKHLLAGVPEWLERHFEARLETAAAAEADAASAPWRQFHAALLAELELRLQPVEGLIEALAEHLAAQANTEPTRQR